MKGITTILAVFIIPVLCCAQEGATTYPVRDMDPASEKFQRVIATVAAQHYERQMDELDLHKITVLQSVGDQIYRVSVGSESYVLKIPDGKIHADGEILSLPVLKTEEVF